MKSLSALIPVGLVGFALTACVTPVRSIPSDFRPAAERTHRTPSSHDSGSTTRV
jgi:hypothetical protein